MLIELSYDAKIQARFVWTARYPLGLRDLIRKQKKLIYNELGQDLRRPELLSGSRIFELDGRKFEVLFVSDRQQDNAEDDIRQLRVTQIDEQS